METTDQENPSGYFSEFSTLGLLDDETLNDIDSRTSSTDSFIEQPHEVVSTIKIGDLPVKFLHFPYKGLSFQIWPSAVVLAKYFHYQISNNLLDIKNKNILELGSGTGFLGAYLSLQGAHSIVTDLGKTVENMKTTLKMNELTEKTTISSSGNSHVALAQELDWCNPPSKDTILSWFQSMNNATDKEAIIPSSEPKQTVDIICATDCVYERTVHNALLQTLLLVCEPTTQIFFANVKRLEFLFNTN